jgi:hypothetical protein
LFPAEKRGILGGGCPSEVKEASFFFAPYAKR